MLSEAVQNVPPQPRADDPPRLAAAGSSPQATRGTHSVARRSAIARRDSLAELADLIAGALAEKLADPEASCILRKWIGGPDAGRTKGPTGAKLIDQYLRHA